MTLITPPSELLVFFANQNLLSDKISQSVRFTIKHDGYYILKKSNPTGVIFTFGLMGPFVLLL